MRDKPNVAKITSPRHCCESDYMGFLGKKKTSRGAYALFCHADLILACRAKFVILFLHDPIHDPWSGPIQILSAPQAQGHFRSF